VGQGAHGLGEANVSLGGPGCNRLQRVSASGAQSAPAWARWGTAGSCATSVSDAREQAR
jgi:hypothetical protein